MSSAIALAAYAVMAGTIGARWLRDARWPNRAPRLAMLAWQALASSVLLALAAGGLALAISLRHVRADLVGLLSLCTENVRHGHASPGDTLTALAGLTLFTALLARTGWCVIRASVADRHDRAARVATIDMIGRSDVFPGATVVDHPTPYAFCIGGRRHRIVVTRGLLAMLDQGELEAVIAHEQAHLRQHHHLAMTLCRGLFATLSPLVPAFRGAMSQVRMYAELDADDGARRHADAGSLRDALLRLACLPAPAGALAASALEVETRLLRLDSHEKHLSRGLTALAAAGIGAAILVPLLLVAGPTFTMAWEAICLLA